MLTSRAVPACRVWVLAAAASVSYAQAPAAGPGASRPAALPASGRLSPAGSVAVEESATPAGTATVGTSVQVDGNFEGSVPEAEVPEGAIELPLAEAVRRGLRTNLGAISAANTNREAAAQRIQALSALMPTVSVGVSETVTQVNLAAYGFQFNVPPSLNFSIPSVVGPFSYSQAQASFSASLYDPVARRNLQAARAVEQAAALSSRDTREMVVFAVAGSYLQTIATAARIESQRAQVANAQAVYNQAEVRKTAGTNARIDVMRTLVELETQKQRLSALEADFRKQKFALARAIGLPLDRELVLTDSLSSEGAAAPEAGEAVRAALRNRSDVKAQEAQVTAAERALAAARAERLPSVSLSGDYGVLGPNPTETHGVFALTGGVTVPVWLGGRVKGDMQQAQATLDQRRAELADQRGRVEQEVRTSLVELETALGQVELAQRNREYAAETLRESRDRLTLGVATTVEVVQAQEQVASAESDYVSSLLALDAARLSLARATGEAEAALPGLLQRKRP